MKTAFFIWSRSQLICAGCMLPLLLYPPVYLFIVGITLVFGLPAIPLFYAVLVLVKILLRHKPADKWVTTLACLPGMLLAAGLCAILACCCVFYKMNDRWEFDWFFVWFGIPAYLFVTIIILSNEARIHQFIYPELYADDFKKDTPQPAGMVNA